MKYPRMLFPEGDISRKEKIVLSADEEAEARKSGYRIAHEADEGEPKTPKAPKEPKTPKAK